MAEPNLYKMLFNIHMLLSVLGACSPVLAEAQFDTPQEHVGDCFHGHDKTQPFWLYFLVQFCSLDQALFYKCINV